MNRQQIIVVIISILTVVVLFRLPRVVVENDEDAEIETHDFSITEKDSEAISSLRQLLYEEKSPNTIIFADSLAKYYLKYGYTDSAYSITEKFLLEDSSLQALEKSAFLMYTLFERSETAEQAAERAEIARDALDKLVGIQPQNLSAKTKLAMTLVSTDRPMVGIQMLREIVDENPEYREGIINLGLLAIRSGQYDRGVERFERALELDSADYEAMLFLGICYQELQDRESAENWFEIVTEAEDADPALQAAALEYLENS